MRSLLSISFLFIVFFFHISNSWASSANGTQSPEHIDELISTLSNKQDREALIKQLQQLQQVSEAATDSPFDSLADSIEQQVVEGIVAEGLLAPLQAIGVQQSQIGELLFLLLAAVVILLAVWLNGRLAGFLYHRLQPLKRRYRMDKHRFHSLYRVQRWSGYLVGFILLLYVAALLFLQLWGSQRPLDVRGILTSTLVMMMIWFIAALIWEGVNALLEIVEFKNRRLKPSRLQTIMPVIRNVLLFFLSLFAGMLLLSELGVDIMPLLAGAGVLGIAIGFGAQTMVKDFLNGAVIIFEDLLQIGDVVQLSGRFGVVERISIRKIQLRDLDGTVYTIPFGEIGIVGNLTKDYSYYLMDVGVAYREDVDEVIACLREVAAELRQDDDFGASILDDLEVLGVDRFADSAVMIKARLMTRAHDKWTVGREFNRRMKAAFDTRGIEIPFPHQTVYFAQDKQGNAASAASVELVNQ